MNIDHIKIEEAIGEAEKKTSGEIIPMLVHASDSYSDVSWSWGFILAMVLTGAFYYLFSQYSFFTYLMFEILAMFLGVIIFDIPQVKKYFLHKKRVKTEVFQRAVEAFYTHGLHATGDRNGILIFVSLLERRVQLLADTGIHQKISEGTLEKVVTQLTWDISHNNLTVGFVKAIEDCGTILSEHFPVSSNDTNELSNKLLTDND